MTILSVSLSDAEVLAPVMILLYFIEDYFTSRTTIRQGRICLPGR